MIPWLKTSGKFPTDVIIPALKTKILLESNPLKSRILEQRLAVVLSCRVSARSAGSEPPKNSRLPRRTPSAIPLRRHAGRHRSSRVRWPKPLPAVRWAVVAIVAKISIIAIVAIVAIVTMIAIVAIVAIVAISYGSYNSRAASSTAQRGAPATCRIEILRIRTLD